MVLMMKCYEAIKTINHSGCMTKTFINVTDDILLEPDYSFEINQCNPEI